MILAYFLACATEPTPDRPDTAAGPDTGDPADSAPDSADTGDSASTCGTWASVGHPFVLGYCTSCHSSRLDEGARYGAPVGVDFDTLAAVQADAERFTDHALGDSPDMPPRGGVPAADREAMAAWLACGAPGDEAPMPEAVGDPRLLGSMILTGGVDASGDGVRLYAEDAGLPWLDEAFVLEAGVGALVSVVRYEDGVEVERRSFEPPLPVYDPDAAELAATVDVTREDPTGTSTATETWTVTRAVEPDPDPRLMEAAPWRVIASSGGEPELQWWFSPTRMVVGQAGRTADDRWYVLLDQNPGALRPADDAFPVEAGGTWATRGYWTREAP